MDFIKKYKPSSIDELISNFKQIHSLGLWLENFEKNKKATLTRKQSKKKYTKTKINEYNCVLITGKHGIGKTVSIEAVCKNKNYTINKYIKHNKTEIDLEKKNVINLLNNNNKKIVTVIDELESISSTQEKNKILNLIKKNDTHWNYPIILISNNQHNKLLSEIKKISYEIKFYKPSTNDLKQIIGKIVKKEGIKFKNINIVNKIIEYTQHDIRKLLYMLEDLMIKIDKNNNSAVTMDMVNDYIKNSQKKDLDFNLFDSAEQLLYDYKSIDRTLSVFESETVLLPLMVHQYYVRNINNNCFDDEQQFELTNEISKSLSLGDVVENQIYGDQNWKMREIHGFYTCVNTSYNLSECIDSEPTKCSLDFPKDLNKTSIKKINKKNIDNTSKCILNKDIVDFMYISKIVKQLIKTNRLEECSRLLKPHGMKIEHIESLLKIEKIRYKITSSDSTKVTLTSKQKKELQSYLE